MHRLPAAYTLTAGFALIDAGASPSELSWLNNHILYHL